MMKTIAAYRLSAKYEAATRSSFFSEILH